MTLLWSRLGERIAEFLGQASDHVYIFAPFILPDALSSVLPGGVSVSLVTSWRGDHLRSGVSSLDVYEICRAHGGVAFYVHPSIHLKVYARDLTRSAGGMLVGSANLTSRALGTADRVNREAMVEVRPVEIWDRVEVQRVISEATLVDDALYARYVSWLAANPGVALATAPEPPPISRAEGPFLLTELPLTYSPGRLWEIASGSAVDVEWWEEDAAVHDLALFGVDSAGSETELMSGLRQRFQGRPFLAAFLNTLDREGVYFGAIKAWIQAVCEDVPTPKRRELTETVKALIQWVADLYPEQYELTRPRHSQRLRRIID